MTDITLITEPTGWFTIRTEDGELQLDPEQFSDLIRSGAHRLGFRLVKPERVAVQILGSSRADLSRTPQVAPSPNHTTSGKAA